MKYRIGDHVHHEMFRQGKIVSFGRENSNQILVLFDKSHPRLNRKGGRAFLSENYYSYTTRWFYCSELDKGYDDTHNTTIKVTSWKKAIDEIEELLI